MGNNLVKVVQRSGAEEHAAILWEQDYYYGSGGLRDGDGIVAKERVVVSYDYDQGRFFVAYVGENEEALSIISSIVSYEDPQPDTAHSQMGYAGASDAQTLKVADKLLKLIGKKRLNLTTNAAGDGG